MRKYKELCVILLMFIFSGFQCESYELTTLNIVEANVFSCSTSGINEILVVNGEQSLVLDTLFADSEGYFMHQFTSYLQTYYLIPATQECSSVLTLIPGGQKSTLNLKQTPLFEALEINFNIDPSMIDSLRIRIITVNDIVNSEGNLVYRDPQNFDSGYTTQWDTLPVSFILGEERNYSFVTEIFPKTGSPSIKSEIIVIHNEPIEKTITF
jgi:hypothetical protein